MNEYCDFNDSYFILKQTQWNDMAKTRIVMIV